MSISNERTKLQKQSSQFTNGSQMVIIVLSAKKGQVNGPHEFLQPWV